MRGHSRFEERIQRRLLDIEAAGLRRRLQPAAGIDLSSNDYLGLSNHPLVKQRMADAALKEGCGAGASRLLRGDREGFHHVEERFAGFKNTEGALYFGSGYAANVGVLSTFIERHDVVLTDEYNHASIVDGIRLSQAKRLKFRHCDVDHLHERLRSVPSKVQKFLVTESVFSMDGDIAPLADYADLCRQTGTVLIVDEAHAVGIFGQRGTGVVEQTATESDVFLTVNPAGKALGVAGAFVAGPALAIDYLIQRARPFIFSTAPPPALAAALEASLTVVESEPDRRTRLFERCRFLHELLNGAGFQTRGSQSQIIPIVIGDNRRTCLIAEHLQRAGFDVRALRPPTVPPGTARLRISVNVNLEPAVLKEFTAELQNALSAVATEWTPGKEDTLEAV